MNEPYMAERLVIRSPLRLKSTQVKIYARELRFEGDGSTNGLIITTGSEDFTFPVPATGPDLTQKGSDGANGVSAGSVDVFVQQFNDATGNTKPKVVLTGGKGQAAGKGKHDGDGTVLFPGDEPHGWTGGSRPTIWEIRLRRRKLEPAIGVVGDLCSL